MTASSDTCDRECCFTSASEIEQDDDLLELVLDEFLETESSKSASFCFSRFPLFLVTKTSSSPSLALECNDLFGEEPIPECEVSEIETKVHYSK